MTTTIVTLGSLTLSGVESEKARQIKEAFEPCVELLNEHYEPYNALLGELDRDATEVTEEHCARARRIRLDLRKSRTRVDKIRKEQKEVALRIGQAVDLVARHIKETSEEAEDRMEDIEKHYERKEQERKTKLNEERKALILPYFPECDHIAFCDMDQDVFEAFLFAKKKAFEDEQAEVTRLETIRIEREKQEAEERERIRVENEKLKKELEEKEKAERKAREEQAARDAENARILKEERDRREAAQKKLKDAEDKRIADERKKKQEEEAERKRKEKELADKAAKPDGEKLEAFIIQINGLITEVKASVTTDKGLAVLKLIEERVKGMTKESGELWNRL